MKHNYNKSIIVVLFIFIVTSVSAQNIQFTFENAVNTNDGSNDFYEADIMIQTIDGLADFLLGPGQMYFNYNTTAFGLNAEDSGNFVVSYPDDQGYMLAEYYDNFGNTYAYSPPGIADNTSSRVSVAFGQAVSSFVMTASSIDAMVNAVPRKLFHIKIKYDDFLQEAQLVFEDNEDQPSGGVNDCRDQFFTAAGSSTTTTLDATNEPGIQFQDALFDNTGAVLVVDDYTIIDIVNLTIYPNPTNDIFYIGGLQEKASLTIYDINGKEIMRKKDYLNEPVNIYNLRAGVYFVEVNNKDGKIVKKLIKK